MMRNQMEEKVREYVMSDTHKLEDYSDIEICCTKDHNDAVAEMEDRIRSSSDEELESFCVAIDAGTVDYIVHGCR